MDNDVLKKGL